MRDFDDPDLVFIWSFHTYKKQGNKLMTLSYFFQKAKKTEWIINKKEYLEFVSVVEAGISDDTLFELLGEIDKQALLTLAWNFQNEIGYFRIRRLCNSLLESFTERLSCFEELRDSAEDHIEVRLRTKGFLVVQCLLTRLIPILNKPRVKIKKEEK